MIAAIPPMSSEPVSAGTKMLPVSVVLPVFNESGNIASLLREIDHFSRRNSLPMEMIVVDDGSSDDSGSIVRGVSQAVPTEIKLIRNERNLGYGVALRRGVQACTNPYILLMDGDGQYDIADLYNFIDKIDPGSAVIGYRAKRNDPWHRRLYGVIWNWIVRRFLGIHVKDVNCGFKLFWRDRLIGLNQSGTAGAFHALLVSDAIRSGLRLIECPVSHSKRTSGSASGGTPAVIVNAMIEIIRFRFGAVGRETRRNCAWLKNDGAEAITSGQNRKD